MRKGEAKRAPNLQTELQYNFRSFAKSNVRSRPFVVDPSMNTNVTWRGVAIILRRRRRRIVKHFYFSLCPALRRRNLGCLIFASGSRVGTWPGSGPERASEAVKPVWLPLTEVLIAVLSSNKQWIEFHFALVLIVRLFRVSTLKHPDSMHICFLPILFAGQCGNF